MNQAPRLLNIGCGRRYHRDWTNIDLESFDDQVAQHDITQGLPYDDSQFDAVYHSHVLEHLDPKDGEDLLEECYRVLKPGGILRVVVPNLEQIATLYLKYHHSAWEGDQQAAVNYNWMKLELLDQLVRSHSGGAMGQYMAGQEIKNSGFVRSRVGDEFSRCQDMGQGRAEDQTTQVESIWSKISRRASEQKLRLTRWLIKRLMGRPALKSFDEGFFRSQGEIHRWMYDRYSLKELCLSKNFVDFQIQTATGSSISNYESFELDSEDGKVRKPDSLFAECRKPIEHAMEKAA